MLSGLTYEKSFHKAFFSAFLVTVTSAIGFLTAFLWRDIIIAALKYYQWYDEENMGKSIAGLRNLIIVTFIITLIAALFIVITFKMDRCI
jgi:hypothetical protein